MRRADWLRRFSGALLLTLALAGPPVTAADPGQTGTPTDDSAQAVSPEKAELAAGLARATVTAQAQEMYNQQKALVAALDLPPELNAAVSGYLGQVRDLLREEMSDASLQRDLMHLYARHFTFDEMLDLRKFFRSHTGQKFLNKMPELVADAGVIVQRRSASILPQLDNFTRQLLENVQQYYSGSPQE